jgi:hypothetical protein
MDMKDLKDVLARFEEAHSDLLRSRHDNAKITDWTAWKLGALTSDVVVSVNDLVAAYEDALAALRNVRRPVALGIRRPNCRVSEVGRANTRPSVLA